jgi:hypothetical protein
MNTKNVVSMITVVFFAISMVFTSCDSHDEIVYSDLSPSSTEAQMFNLLANELEESGGISLQSIDCPCTKYIANRLGITNYPAAQYWGPTLVGLGYSLVSVSTSALPQNKDVIIFHTNYGSGINSTNGHIGMIATATLNGNNIRVEVVGTSQQQSSVWSEYNCDNVSIMNVSSLNTAKVSVYRK